MGGYGSGKGLRWNTTRTKLFTTQLFRLDSFQLIKRHEEALSGTNFQWLHIHIDVLLDRVEAKSLDESKKLSVTCIRRSQTPCNYGGARHWFVCPYCHKNARYLYLKGSALACRSCCKLAYLSQNLTFPHRLCRKEDKILKRLKEKGGNEYRKPKWMHQKTFRDLTWKAERLSDLAALASGRGSRTYSQVNAPFTQQEIEWGFF